MFELKRQENFSKHFFSFNMFFSELKMPKYSKACHNRHFHEKRGSDAAEVYTVNLCRSGLSELAKTFVNFLNQELDIKSPTVLTFAVTAFCAVLKSEFSHGT